MTSLASVSFPNYVKYYHFKIMTMIEERIYLREELHSGKCDCCGEESDEITDSGLCVDCIEEERFINETFSNKHQSPFDRYE